MTDAEQAYAKAEELIAEALETGSKTLRFDGEETRELEALPPQIAGLEKLSVLNLNYTNVSNLSHVSELTSLQELELGATQVHDLSPVSGLDKLSRLTLWRTPVHDLSAIQNLYRLDTLDISYSKVTNLSSVQYCKILVMLFAEGTRVVDVSPLSKLHALAYLYLSDTDVLDLNPLAELYSLVRLEIRGTPAQDLRPLAELTGLVSNHDEGLLFEDCAAARTDEQIAAIAELKNGGDRTQALFDYLKDWVPPGAGAMKPPALPKLPLEKPAPLRTGFSDGRMLRTGPANLPVEDALERAEKGWNALRAYRSEFGDSFNVHNYAPLPSFLSAFDRAMGDRFDPENLIMIGVMGSRLTGLSQNKEFLACLPTGADTDLQGFGAAIAVYLERFKDWTDYQADKGESDVSLGEVIDHVDGFEDMARSLRETPEVDVAVSDEYASELAEIRETDADDVVARGFDASHRELVRNLAEKGIEEVKSGRLVRESVDDMDKMADGEFTKVKFYSYGWTLVLLKRNQGPLRRMSKRYPWLGPALDYLVGAAPDGDNQN